MKDGIIEIFKSIVDKVSEDLSIELTDFYGCIHVEKKPHIQYVFGNAQYIKDVLDTYSKSEETSSDKLPMIALFSPITEQRGNSEYFTEAKVNLLIACATTSDLSNDERLETSFKRILRPIYERLIYVLKTDMRFDWGYNPKISHEYSENYSYGKYGAYTESGDAVSEPIDAINIRSLDLKIKNINNCNRLKL